jgi:hypothetical protein
MWPWNAATQGYVYLFHFHRPLGNLTNRRAQARHYVGFAEDIKERLEIQCAGAGAKIVAAAVARQIPFEVFWWPAPLIVEKLVKRTKKAALYCPTCCAAAGRKPRSLPVPATQLALPLEYHQCDITCDTTDFPDPPALAIDWLEINYLRRARSALAPALAGDDWDAGLL